jgi:hypothetical protein
VPANDNLRTKDRLSALLRRFIALHSCRLPD